MLKFTYYGHACFLLDDGKYKLLFDPYLTGNPMAKVKAEDISCDYILVTHAHGDHAGDAASVAQRTGAKVIAVPEVLDFLQVKDVCPMNIGGVSELSFGRVKMVQALHSSGVPGGAACGFVVRCGELNLYYAGDTGIFSDMKLIGEETALDWAVLPIGDNYTMGPEEAAKAVKLLGAPQVIPVHYNTWPIIAQDPEKFKNLAEKESGAKVYIVKPGAELELDR